MDNEGKSKEIEVKKLEPSDVAPSEEKARGSRLFKEFGKLAGAVKEDYKESYLKKQVEEATQQTKEFLDDKGVTQKVGKAYDATQEHLDTVGGTKLLRLVEERLELQAKYNDILATKLQEALERIEALEGFKDRLK